MSPLLVVMGVSGSGKTTLGTRLAARLHADFVDADDLHPPENVARMAAGEPLGDADRWPWLDRVHERLADAAARERPLVVACSALKASYRARLASGGIPIRFVYLAGSPAVIAERLAARTHAFMPASLLDSQFAALEPPGDAIVVDAALSTERQVECVERALLTAGG